MKEKIGKSQTITGSVMEFTDFMVLLCLLMACGTTVVFAQRQELNGPCLHVKECNKIGYICASNRTCQCRPGYTPNEKMTKCVGFIGSRCFYDIQCIEGAYCSLIRNREACKCRDEDDYYPSEDGESCLNSAWTLHKKPSATLALLTVLWTGLYLNT